jgi:hypothetical protein
MIGDKYVDGFRISVETYEGVVTLRGEVQQQLPTRAGGAARNVGGRREIGAQRNQDRAPAREMKRLAPRQSSRNRRVER